MYNLYTIYTSKIKIFFLQLSDFSNEICLHTLHKWHNNYYDYVGEFINSHIQEESSFQNHNGLNEILAAILTL